MLVKENWSLSPGLWTQDGQCVSSLSRTDVNKGIFVMIEEFKTTHFCDILFEPNGFASSWGIRPPNEKKHRRSLTSSRLRPFLSAVRTAVI